MRKIPKRLKMYKRLAHPVVYSVQMTDAVGNVTSVMLGTAFTYLEAQILRTKFKNIKYWERQGGKTVKLVVQKVDVPSGKEVYPDDARPWCWQGSKIKRYVNYHRISIKVAYAKGIMEKIKPVRRFKTPWVWYVQFIGPHWMRSEMLGVAFTSEDERRLRAKAKEAVRAKDAVKLGPEGAHWWRHAEVVHELLDAEQYGPKHVSKKVLT